MFIFIIGSFFKLEEVESIEYGLKMQQFSTIFTKFLPHVTRKEILKRVNPEESYQISQTAIHLEKKTHLSSCCFSGSVVPELIGFEQGQVIADVVTIDGTVEQHGRLAIQRLQEATGAGREGHLDERAVAGQATGDRQHRVQALQRHRQKDHLGQTRFDWQVT